MARVDGGTLTSTLDVTVTDSRSEQYTSLMAVDHFGDLWLRDAKRDSVGRVSGQGVTFAAAAP